MQRVRRRPRAEPHAADLHVPLAGGARAAARAPFTAIAWRSGSSPSRRDLDPLHRRVDVARGAGGVVSSPSTCHGSSALRSSRRTSPAYERADERTAQLDERRDTRSRGSGRRCARGERARPRSRATASTGSRKRSWSSLPQRDERVRGTAPRRTRRRARGRARPARRPCAGAAASRTRAARRALGGRTACPGRTACRCEISARWVCPATSTSKWRKSCIDLPRRAAPASANTRQRELELVRARRGALRRRRGACDVGPTNRPVNRYDERRMVLDEGDEAREQVGPLDHGELASGVGPPSVMWLPPPMPAARPSSR